MTSNIESNFSSSFYTFIRQEQGDNGEVYQMLLESVYQKAAHSREVQKKFFETYGSEVVAAALKLATVYHHGGKLLIAGNGGSACDSGNIAVEFSLPSRSEYPSLPVINLTAETALITGLMNSPGGVENVFTYQLISKGKKEDAFIGISTSGNSKNLMAAFAKAKSMGMTTIALAGGDGGLMAKSKNIDHCFVAEIFSIHRTQEVHLVLYHILWDLVHRFLVKMRSGSEYNEANDNEVTSAFLELVYQKAADSREVQEQFFNNYGTEVVAASYAVAAAYERGGQIIAAGNGTSACDSAHIAVEFLHPVTAGRPALPAIDLSSEAALITALMNDVGVENVFVRQLIAKGKKEDVFIGISTNENSNNLMPAFAKAKVMGMNTIALTGGDSRAMLSKDENVDHWFVIESNNIHQIQEVHLPIYHILWDLVHTLLADKRGSTSTKKK
jgi:D-sedoheptulose 7-phosphate isomerase